MKNSLSPHKCHYRTTAVLGLRKARMAVRIRLVALIQERSVVVRILERWFASQPHQLGTPLRRGCRVWQDDGLHCIMHDWWNGRHASLRS